MLEPQVTLEGGPASLGRDVFLGDAVELESGDSGLNAFPKSDQGLHHHPAGPAHLIDLVFGF
jgi:hypothetical protein